MENNVNVIEEVKKDVIVGVDVAAPDNKEEKKEEKKARTQKVKEDEVLPKVIKEKANEHFTLQVIKELSEANTLQFRLKLVQAGKEVADIDEIKASRIEAIEAFRAVRKQLNSAVKEAKTAAKKAKDLTKETAVVEDSEPIKEEAKEAVQG